MKLTIDATPKEIADLVHGVQDRQKISTKKAFVPESSWGVGDDVDPMQKSEDQSRPTAFVEATPVCCFLPR